MNIKQTVAGLILAVVTITSLSLVGPSVASATCDPNTQNCCGGVETSLVKCDQTGTGGTVENTGAWGLLLMVINILTAGVGIAAVGGIVYASILYTSAGGNPEQTKKAMGMITNIVIGIIAYAFMFALLNFITPGGLFN